MEDILRIEYIFRGDVQGVGFRYRAKYAAAGCGVTGWVKNEWDGTVRMEAQGTKRQLNEMLKLINSSPYIRIDRIDRKDLPVNKGELGFHVR